MKAKDLFKELDFQLEDTNEALILYYKEDDGVRYEIVFYKLEKIYGICGEPLDEKDKNNIYMLGVDEKLHQAITKQLEEL